MIVVDASVWVDRLRGLLQSDLAEIIRTEGCASPPHVDFEVGAALLRLARRDDLTHEEATTLIEVFAAHPVERIRVPVDAVRATELLDNATYADAWYLALAERLAVPIVTIDTGMVTAATVNGIDVIPSAPVPASPAGSSREHPSE